MRPRKTIRLYHPIERQALLYRYALDIALMAHVIVAQTVGELDQPCDVTIRWKKDSVVIENAGTVVSRELSVMATNPELFEAVRACISRKRGPRKESHDAPGTAAAEVA